MAAHGGEKCFLNEILRDLGFAHTSERITIKHIAVFIDPAFGVIASYTGCRLFDSRFRHATADTFRLKRHAASLTKRFAVVKIKKRPHVRSAAFRRLTRK